MLEWIIRSVLVVIGAAIIGMIGAGTDVAKIVLVLIAIYGVCGMGAMIVERRRLNS